MATQIAALQPNGESLVLEVTPETTGQALKQQIKERKSWDELTRSTTGVEIIVGDIHLLAHDAKVLDAGIAESTVVSVVFKPNVVICSNKKKIASLGGIVDPELFLVVEIPYGETAICEGAFKFCTTLAKVTIPDSVTHIGDFAFEGCSSLVNLIIPDSVTHIGIGAFRGCSSLVDLTIPNSVTHIEDCAFQHCNSLANLTMPDSVAHFGNEAMAGCSSLVNLTIPDSVTRIWEWCLLSVAALW